MALTSLIIVVVALLISALISGSETAFLASDKYRVKQLVASGDKRAKALVDVLSNPERMFGAILLTNNLVNILIATLVGATVSNIVGSTTAVGIAVSTTIATIVIVIFSELLPKSLATAIPIGWSLSASKPMKMLIFVTFPLIYLLSLLPRGMLFLLGIKSSTSTPTVTTKSLRMLVDIGEEEGELEDHQGEMLEKVFRLSEKTATDIMTPRNSIVWANYEDTVEDFLEHYKKHKKLRLPVLSKKKSDAVGIVSYKDVILEVAKKSLKKPVHEIMKPPQFVFEGQPLDDLFNSMSHHIAIVLDEHTEIIGLVTRNSLVEEVVGPISGSLKRSKTYAKIAPNKYSVSGYMSIEKLRDELDLKIPSGDYDTLGGWFYSLSKSEPYIGQTASVDGITMQITKLENSQIVRIELTQK